MCFWVGYSWIYFLLTTRNITQHRLRAVFSALAVSLGVAMIITADFVSSSLLATLQNSGEGTMQITHGFIVEQFDLTIGLVGYVLMGAAAFLIFNAFAMSITERQQQIGALRSLGMTCRQILGQVLLEALIIGSLGTVAGLLLGPIMGRGVVSFMQRFGGEFLAFGDGSVTWGTAVLAGAIGLGITLLSALIPARHATRISPLAAMRQHETGDWKLETRNRQSLISSLLISALFVYLAIAPPGEWIETPWSEALAIGLVSVWLVCLGLLLPLLIRLVGTVTRRWLGKISANGHGAVTARLIGDNIQRSRGRVILTILTLAVGLGTITGLTGFMTYAFDDLMGASIRRIAEQNTWAVFPFDLESGIAGLTELDDIELPAEAITAVEKAANGRAGIVPVRFVIVPELSFFGDTYFTYVADPSVIRDNPNFFRFTEGDWETAMPIMTGGCGALIAPLIANRQNVGVGDRLAITGPNGPMNCTIAGIGAGYVNASIIGENVGDELGATQPIGLSITPRPGVDVAALEADLQQAVAATSGAYLTRMTDFAELQGDALGLFAAALNGMLLLAVVAAALGVINTTVMSIHERRRELGLLRAVGATRRQIRQVIMGENALIGLVGAIFGIVAGMGSVVIIVTTLGGNAWGVTDLDLWPAAGRALRPTITNGIVGILAAPLISAWVSRWPVRSLLHGTAIETLNPEHQPESAQQQAARLFSRGSIRTRFVAGTAVLMLLVLWGLTGTVTRHARNYLEKTTADAMTAMVELNASLMEYNLPPDADTLTLDLLQGGSLDAEMLLQFRSLLDEMDAYGLVEFAVTDRDDIVLFGFDVNQIGTSLEPLTDVEHTSTAVSETETGQRQIFASAPIRNENGDRLGSVRLRLELGEIANFLRDLNQAVLGVGLLILLLGLALAWAVTTPLVRATRRLAAQAGQVSQGRFEPFVPPRLRLNLSLRTKLTAVLILLLVLLVGLLEWVVLPIERRKVEEVSQKTLIAGAEWAAELLSTGLAEQSQPLSQVSDMGQLLQLMQGTDVAQIQELSDQLRNDNIAYSALINEAGVIQLSDQFSLMGEETAVPNHTLIEETEWQDEAIWRVTTPLRDGDSREINGALQIGVRQAAIDTFLAESRTLFNLTGIIAVLAGVILAQAIGGAVVAPVRRLAADTRRVGQGDLSVQFSAGNRDELAVLAQAYNDMVAGLREREWLRDMFGRFVSQEVAEAIRSGQVRLEGENRVVSVLFCDIRGFTARSEKATPAEIVALLNQYLPVVVSAAQKHDGTVNKFGGDSTLVIYGAPRPLQESAYHAVQTALEMRQNLARLNQVLAAQGQEPIQIGVGINTGVVLAGAVGPPERQEYTVIGDTVNLASRIEALNKEYPQHGILISGQTYEALGSRRTEFAFTDLGEVQIRGKAAAVRVWAVEAKGA